MQVHINQDMKPLIEKAVRSGRCKNIDEFVNQAVREKVLIDQAVDARLVELAQEVQAANDFEQGPRSLEQMKALVAARRTA
ncbi:MAG: hypothetical protein V3V20_06160 [Algisphaera sp.]